MLRVLLVNFKGYSYAVSALVILTEAEVTALMELSAGHYDGRCKAAGKVGGFLYGINNAVCVLPGEMKREHPVRLDWHEVDTLCKILEQMQTPEHAVLYTAMKQLLAKMSDESRRVND